MLKAATSDVTHSDARIDVRGRSDERPREGTFDHSYEVAVLLATYNGERFIQAQLDSLWGQTHQDFIVLVRDDGSTDKTLDILELAAVRYPGRVRIIHDDRGRLGPGGSFSALMEVCASRWILFCDQDDYWFPDKIERQVGILQALEQKHGASTPLMCCGDVQVADSALHPMGSTYYGTHHIDIASGRDLRLPRLIFRNFAIGAASAVNAALVRRALPVPPDAIMHDWWCALWAAATGVIAVVPGELMLYRQHAGNAIGSRRRGMPRSWQAFMEYLNIARKNSLRSINQVQALSERLSCANGVEARELERGLGAFHDFAEASSARRLLTMLAMRAFKPGLALNLLHLWAASTTRAHKA